MAAITAAGAAQAAGPAPGPGASDSTLQSRQPDANSPVTADDGRAVLAQAKVAGSPIGFETGAAPTNSPALQAAVVPAGNADIDAAAPGSQAYALLLAGLAMMLALARRRRRDSF